jgi:hypothetical protein
MHVYGRTVKCNVAHGLACCTMDYTQMIIQQNPISVKILLLLATVNMLHITSTISCSFGVGRNGVVITDFVYIKFQT